MVVVLSIVGSELVTPPSGRCQLTKALISATSRADCSSCVTFPSRLSDDGSRFVGVGIVGAL